MHVCYCLLGTPVGLEADFATKVKSFWDAYRSQLSSDETLEQDTVEVEVTSATLGLASFPCVSFAAMRVSFAAMRPVYRYLAVLSCTVCVSHIR